MGSVTQRSFGRLPDGREADLFQLTLDDRFCVSVCNYGASLIGVVCPDRHGSLNDVVLGCDSVSAQAAQTGYLGAAIGRVAGRISGSAFEIDGNRYVLSSNEGTHHLHGGSSGFSHRFWHTEILGDGRCGVTFHLTSEDGDQGYPGEIHVSLTYEVLRPGKLVLAFTATASAATWFNPTSHGYFNLEGHDGGSIADHQLQIFADYYTPTGADLIPTGAIEPVSGTAFDFILGKPISRDWTALERGYDRNFVLCGLPDELRTAAIMTAPSSGRKLIVTTDRPCVHLYTGGWLDVASGKDGIHYGPFSGLCLETQGFPDALNHEGFPSDILHAGKTFRSRTIFQFETETAL